MRDDSDGGDDGVGHGACVCVCAIMCASRIERQLLGQNTNGCKKLCTLLDLCVSSLRRGHANLLCIVPILTDDPRRESESVLERMSAIAWAWYFADLLPSLPTAQALQKKNSSGFFFEIRGLKRGNYVRFFHLWFSDLQVAQKAPPFP